MAPRLAGWLVRTQKDFNDDDASHKKFIHKVGLFFSFSLLLIASPFAMKFKLMVLLVVEKFV